MTEILTESYCERCGARFTFESASAGGGPISRARTVARGLRNYLISDSSLDEALAEARREHERHASGAQLQAFHETFNFCLSCRQYVCTDCWNQAAGRCRTCAPLPGVPDPLDLRALQTTRDRLETAPVPPAPSAPTVAALAETGTQTAAGPRPTLEPATVDVLAWPAEDRPAPATAGHAEAEVGGVAVGGAEAAVPEAAVTETAVAPQAEAVPEAAMAPQAAAETVPDAIDEPQSLLPLAPELEHPSEALSEPELAAGPRPQSVPELETAPEPEVEPEDVAEQVSSGRAVGEPTPSAMPIESPAAAPTGNVPASPPALPEIPRVVLEIPRTALQPPEAAAPAITPWQVVAPDEAPAPPARLPSPSANPRAAREPGPGNTMGWLLRRRDSAQSQVSSRITRNVWEESTRDLVTRSGTGIQACQSCGLPLSANARFCRRCGARQG